MKVATWHVAGTSPHGAKGHARAAAMVGVDADLWLLTEVHEDLRTKGTSSTLP